MSSIRNARLDNILTVGKLKEIIKHLDDDMEVITSRYSDFDTVKESEPEVIKAFPSDEWITRYHPTMSDEKKGKCKGYLFICEGN